MNTANDPALKSWIEVQKLSDFPIQNIPFGVIRNKNGQIRCATRIGDYAIDLHEVAAFGHFDDLDMLKLNVFNRPFLNYFMAYGKPAWTAIRNRLSELFRDDNPVIRDVEEEKATILHPISEIEMQMPVRIGDYTDFYSSIEHATNVGKMFRDPQKALLPNWRHIPVGYHGRKSSIVLSGTEIHRPNGQSKPDNSNIPVFGPSEMLDFELEMAFFTGMSTRLGENLPLQNTEDAIFGLVIMNDLSARDIQKWEYVPLGPFLGKSFGTVISPWIVTLDALEPFRVSGPEQKPDPLPYLKDTGKKNYDIQLEVQIQSEDSQPATVCRSNFRHMYWNMSQQLAHQTVNGCNINVGDIYGSGTISGPEPDSYGSMLELTLNGSKPLSMPDGSKRKFLEDHDTVILKGCAEKNGIRIGFGDCVTKILPAR